VGLEVANQFCHRLFRHPGPLGEQADGRARVVEVLEHRRMRRPDGLMPLLGEPGEHDVVQPQVGLPEQDDQVGRALAAVQHRQRSCHRQDSCLSWAIWTCYLSTVRA
jgi:hypothetical protein